MLFDRHLLYLSRHPVGRRITFECFQLTSLFWRARDSHERAKNQLTQQHPPSLLSPSFLIDNGIRQMYYLPSELLKPQPDLLQHAEKNDGTHQYTGWLVEVESLQFVEHFVWYETKVSCAFLFYWMDGMERSAIPHDTFSIMPILTVWRIQMRIKNFHVKDERGLTLHHDERYLIASIDHFIKYGASKIVLPLPESSTQKTTRRLAQSYYKRGPW